MTGDIIHLAAFVPVIPVLNRWENIHKSIFPFTTCTDLVVWNKPGTLGSTLGLPKFTKFLRYSVFIPDYLIGVFVGLFISDASLTMATSNSNPRMAFKQSIINFPFFWSTFMLLSHYIAGMPYQDWTTLKVNGKTYLAIRFDTRAYPVLHLIHELFFVNGRKVISPELYHYLNPTALAYWIMSDGAFKGGGLILCTDCFTVPEVVLLMNILTIRYGFICTINMVAGLPRIYISRRSMVSLRKIVGPHMLEFSNYKLYGLRGLKRNVTSY